MNHESQADQLIANLDKACHDAILIPNSWLPEHWHNKKTGFVGADTIHAKLDKKEEESKPSKHQVAKQNRSENIEIYKDDASQEEAIAYDNHTDQAKLYENMQSFAKYCPSISLDD
mgnify:CR=1 FL=1|tara:strand:- start:1054 stop:1401 length:348 start_codon:yes stop_codon:yes gene_type:complete